VTRINVVPPSELTRQHLVAEYRELPRVFSLVLSAQERGESPATVNARAPAKYVLGTGHVLFFYTRLEFCLRRQCDLVEEMRARGYNPRHDDPYNMPIIGLLRCHWFDDWTPTPEAVELSRRRLAERTSR
jgi:deoxyribonuclease (pyrimidine dimer)